MQKKVLFSATNTEKRVALLENDRLAELVVERPDHYQLVGNIYRGRVESILPGLQAAFVDIGIGKGAFLHASEVDPTLLLDEEDALLSRLRDKRRKTAVVPIERILKKGQQILVQIIKEPIGTKGPKITTQISLAGRFLVLVPDTDFVGVSKKMDDDAPRRRVKKIIAALKPKGIGFIVRTIGLTVSEQEFTDEIKQLINDWYKIQDSALEGTGTRLIHQELGITSRVMRDMLSDDVKEVWVDSIDDFNEIESYLRVVSPHLRERVFFYNEKLPVFDKFNIEKDLEQSLKRKVWLKSGGYILLDHTEALLAIDVNTGRNVGKHDLETTILQTNIEAANEICRQLRLRDIGGLIVVDFIDMNRAENRSLVENTMRQLLKTDSSTNACTSLSKFGLMEITRKRVRPELQELYTDVCTVCNGLGWVFSPGAISARIERWLRRTSATGLPSFLRLVVHPAVGAYLLTEESWRIHDMEKKYQIKLLLENDEGLDQDEFEFYEKDSLVPVGK